MSGLPRDQWEWFGHSGHLIVGRDCRFHLCTYVGGHIVSTVGEYLPDSSVRETIADVRGVELEGIGDERRADYMRKIGYETIGIDRLYETMVFSVGEERCEKVECGGCGMPIVDDWGELDFDGYNDAASASRGHLALCEKWAAGGDP